MSVHAPFCWGKGCYVLTCSKRNTAQKGFFWGPHSSGRGVMPPLSAHKPQWSRKWSASSSAQLLALLSLGLLRTCSTQPAPGNCSANKSLCLGFLTSIRKETSQLLMYILQLSKHLHLKLNNGIKFFIFLGHCTFWYVLPPTDCFPCLFQYRIICLKLPQRKRCNCRAVESAEESSEAALTAAFRPLAAHLGPGKNRADEL